MQITRRLEFDAGHRIPNHKGQCRHLHGHRYAIEITLSGNVLHDSKLDADGMVMDFSEIKRVANEHLIDRWDHAFFVYRADKVVADFLGTLPDHRTVVLDVTPTVENLARVAFDTLSPLYQDVYGNHLRLEKVRLYETPNCWADVVRESNTASPEHQA